MLTRAHNASDPREVDRVRQQHPGETDCLCAGGRVLGTIAPFQCMLLRFALEVADADAITARHW